MRAVAVAGHRKRIVGGPRRWPLTTTGNLVLMIALAAVLAIAITLGR